MRGGRHIGALVFAGLGCLALACQAAAGSAGILHKNPFAHPLPESSQPVPGAANPAPEVPVPLELRGTMLAGADSLANIGGLILGIGQEVDGYRIVAIHERQVVVEKNGEQRTLSVDNEDVETRNN
jgi:hypothetical protein